MTDIHVTERDTFKFCRRQWKYSYQEHLVPKSQTRNALWVGRGTHFALATYYRDNKNPIEGFEDWFGRQVPQHQWQNMMPDEKREVEGIKSLVHSMLSGYLEFAKKHDSFQVVAVEDPIRIRLPGTYHYLVGTLDLLVRYQGKLWVVDHKTYQTFVSPDDLELDDQMTAYLWLVWQKYREYPAGAIYNMLRKKVPATPLVLKSGQLSRDKSIDTTPEKYRQAIRENGLSEADYADSLLGLEKNEFYRRELVARTRTELHNFTDQLKSELQEIRSKQTPLYPYAKRDCTWGCSYRMLCKCENEGGDLQALKNVNYERVERRQE